MSEHIDVKKKVLIVEDDAIIAASYSSILKIGGYQVVGQEQSGFDAIKTLKNTEADIILMDIKLTDITGIETMEKIREFSDIPCVFITAYMDDDLMRRANDLGAFAYIIKPIRDKQLLATVHTALCRAEEFKILKKETVNMKQALADRKVVERAKGILMRRREISEEEAMRLLQKLSKDRNRKLAEMAKDIVQADQLL